jgi:hypothetical protein
MIVSEKRSCFVCSLLEFIVKTYTNNIISENTRQLLELIYDNNIKQKQLDDFLSNYDIEEEPEYEKLLLLSYLEKTKQNLDYGKYNTPRIRGIFEYYKFSNIKVLSGFSKIGKILNEAKIPILLFKGGVMKFFRPELSRPMGDVDFLVPLEKYKKALDIALNNGFNYKVLNKRTGRGVEEEHSVDLVGKNNIMIDIHRYTLKGDFIKYSAAVDREIFARAKKTLVFGVEVFLPCKEDLLFLVLTNLYHNIVSVIAGESSEGKTIIALFDTIYLIGDEKQFNWDIFIGDLKKSRTTHQAKLVSMLFEELISLPVIKQLNSKIPLDMISVDAKKLLTKNILDLFFKDFLQNKKTIHWSKIRRSGIKNIVIYLIIKLRYLGFKAFRNMPGVAMFFLPMILKNKIGKMI